MKVRIRITGGIVKGRTLESPKEYQTRPALARVRNSLFNIIQSTISEANVLDLFAGTGSLGLESLSRGARFCLFVENDRQCFSLIKKNITRLGFDKQSKVVFLDGFKVIPLILAKQYKFDIIFIDPPYRLFEQANIREKLFSLLGEMTTGKLLSQQGLVIIEHRSNQLFTIDLDNLRLVDQRKYGQTMLSFLAPLEMKNKQ